MLLAAGYKVRVAAYRLPPPASKEPDLVSPVVLVHSLQMPVPKEPDLV
jgi:hypothetical protein